MMTFKKCLFLLFMFEISFANVPSIMTEAQFNAMFPNRSTGACGTSGASNTFSYANLVSAAAWFPEFANSGSAEVQKRELAAFLAQTAHETTGGWSTAPGGPFEWGYCYTEELNCAGTICDQYTVSNSSYPAQQGKSYHGRGAIQLSWNYNYGEASKQLTGDKMLLLNNPEMVKTSDWAFKTALWYWMDSHSGRPSPHRIITGKATGDDRALRFGSVTNAVNGGIECGSKTAAQIDRVGFFKEFASDLGITAKPSNYSGSDDSYFYCLGEGSFASKGWTGQDIDGTICVNGDCGDGFSSVVTSSVVSSSSSTTGNSSTVVSSTTNGSSSSIVDGECIRTRVSGLEFDLTNGSINIAGHQLGNEAASGGPFADGAVVVPAGQDCSLALTIDHADNWNLYATSAWQGGWLSRVELDLVTYSGGTSSNGTVSSTTGSSSEATVISDCDSWFEGICAWDGLSYDCGSDKITSDGTNAYTCAAGAEIWCNGFGPDNNSWNQWTENGTCVVEKVESLTEVTSAYQVQLVDRQLMIQMGEGQVQSLLIVDANGNPVLEEVVQGSASIDLSELNRGNYFVRIQGETSQSHRVPLR